MTHMSTLLFPDNMTSIESAAPAIARCQPVLIVVSDDHDVASVLDNVCDFLGFGIELLSSHDDLEPVLMRQQPMAVVTQLDGRGQDGCHVMKQVADYDPGLPILMLMGHEPGLSGAVDAVAEAWNLTGVTMTADLPPIGQLVEFLFQAGRRGDCVRMMPT